MSGRHDQSLLLDDIVDAAERLVDLGSDTPAGTLGLDRARNEMILWNLVVLGEAAKRLSDRARERFADIPWNGMARTRDRTAHHYEGIDWETVAGVLDTELPALLPRLVEIRDVLRAEFDAG